MAAPSVSPFELSCTKWRQEIRQQLPLIRTLTSSWPGCSNSFRTGLAEVKAGTTLPGPDHSSNLLKEGLQWLLLVYPTPTFAFENSF